MTLEDFFTLTEMKDGLMALARVEELVSVMKEEKDTNVTNISEAARQWCTVASTLAATENKDILDHFIRLDGLYFLDRWLQEAQKCSSDASDSFVEESIVALLRALEKLPIDNDRSVSSGISVTVKNLCDVKSFMVQERARALFESWTQRSNKDADHQVVEKNTGCHYNGVKPVNAIVAVESGCLQDSIVESSPAKGSADLDNHVDKPAGGECENSRCADSYQSDSIKDVKISSPNNQDTCQKTLSCVNKEDASEGNPRGSSTMTKPCQESLSIMEERKSSMGTHNSPVQMESNVDGRSLDVPELKALSNDERETDTIKRSQDRHGKTEICSVSASSEHVSSSADPVNVQHAVTQSTTQSNFDAKGNEFFLKKTLPADLDGDTLASKPKIGMVDGVGQEHSRSTVEREATDRADGCYSNVLQDISSTRNVLRKPGDMEASFSRKEDIGVINNVKELAGESILKVGGGKDSATAGNVSKSMIDTKVLDKIDKRRSDLELEYGVEDALEVARQVAKEVEREVVDYRKEFCSSSSEKNSGGVAHPGSPDSINGEQEQHVTGPQNEVRIRKNLSSGALSPNGKNHSISTDNTDKPQECMHDQDSSQVTEAAQEPVVNIEKGMCHFDLNEEVFLEEMDHPTTPSSAPSGSVASGSAPITVVSASKAAAPGFPMAPLHFEGELGWKGSAATSAFRPASVRRTPEAEKSISVEGSSQSSKQRQDFRYIDLNVAEGDTGGATDPVLSKQVPVSSDLHSGESSIEVSSRRAERLKLDLNRIGDNEETPSDWKMEGGFVYHHRNGHYSPSPASSSSSRPPSMRNFDLNDNPSFLDHSNDLRPDLGKASSLDMNTCVGAKLDDPVISIMGTRVEINKNEFVPQTRSFLPNGQVPEFLMGTNFAKAGGGAGVRSTMAYTSSPPIYGYNGLTAGSSMSLSPAMYGPGSVHYMVDSRGAPVVPQVMGSPVAAPSTYSRPQFLMSTTGPLSGLNGVATPRPNFDLNSGLTVEAENREPGGFRQLFIPGQGVLMEEQMRSTSQPMNSGMGMKRKEPEGGWDLYPGGYKQKAPWQ
ncbi:Transcription factor IIS [Macleaya cordata]|uniref:Transcription factor IIS n=1 Tax=Macleaya cordata TaxID=56857 RepID=A0A200RA68_MACCD|nr:Transcription factor IIS [Macleaya cordata]